MTKKPPLQMVGFRIPSASYREMRRIAENHGLQVSGLLRCVVAQFLRAQRAHRAAVNESPLQRPSSVTLNS